jgi:LacI family transcriptional regulator
VVLRKDKFDAVVCYNDMVAIGFLGAARSLGIAVPADISVVGIDNIPSAASPAPPSPRSTPKANTWGGRHAPPLRLIEGDAAVNSHVRVEPRLVVRDSTRERG